MTQYDITMSTGAVHRVDLSIDELDGLVPDTLGCIWCPTGDSDVGLHPQHIVSLQLVRA